MKSCRTLPAPPIDVQNSPSGSRATAVWATVPAAFVQRMLSGAQKHLTRAQMADILRGAGIAPNLFRMQSTRVTREQFARLYAAIAISTGDEMLGLWSRPIRSGALKHLGLNLLHAPSVLIALYRFTRFWNLLLDDYSLELSRGSGQAHIRLTARAALVSPNVFGHELMIKLIHGMASWLAGAVIPVRSVDFAYARPAGFSEYAHLFPEKIGFEQPQTGITFDEADLDVPYQRSKAELIQFVRRAPDDWLFHSLDQTSFAARVRALVMARLPADLSLARACQLLRVSERTLSRRLAREGTGFRGIRSAVQRDLAVERLLSTSKPIAHVALEVGFTDLPAFHRAFRTWTGSTPSAYRRQRRLASVE
jgi:AraC-like DNA-binding protein